MNDRLVLVDLETTGLTATQDYILEVGLVVTDAELNVLGSWSSLVKNPLRIPRNELGRVRVPRSDDWLDRIKADDHVEKMHEQSGLLDEIRLLPDRDFFDGQSLTYQPVDVSYRGYLWLTDTMGLEAGKYPMVGNSVHFDRRFLDEHMRVLLGFWTYRNLDVSSVKEAAKVFNPELYEAMTRDPRFDKANAKHRALPDLYASIEELKFYKEHFLGTSSVQV